MQFSCTIDSADVQQAVNKLDKITGRNVIAAAASDVARAIRQHLRGLSGRHATADRLGATPTDHLSPTRVQEPEVGDGSAVITVAIPGISRAYRDIDITPSKRYLTIPIHAAAYGARAAEAAMGRKPFFFKTKKGSLIMAVKNQDKKVVPLYLLLKSVHQRRDPTLLPSQSALRRTFTDSVLDILRSL